MKWTTAEQNAIREDIFKWLEVHEIELGGYEFRREFLANEYYYKGTQLSLMDRQNGIWNPRGFDSTLSITKTLKTPYSDDLDGEIQRYSYERLPNRPLVSGRNLKLRVAAATGVPLILFQEVYPTLYIPRYPVYIVYDDPDEGYVNISLEQTFELFNDPVELAIQQRRYSNQLIRARLHQKSFRTRVLHVYEATCAICTLSHPELLDAAHITPDIADNSSTSVTNGIALCKIHHAAYDRHLIGIDGDYVVHIREDIKLEVNGPMLKHGIQEMNGRSLHVPRRYNDRPDPERLHRRFNEFALRSTQP